MKKQTKNKTCIPFGNTAKAFAQNFLLILTALVLGFFPYRAFAQNPDFLFAKGIGGGAGGSDEGKSIAVDPDGNMYVTGYFAGLVDFDPSASAALRFSTGGNDLFLAKYNASGNFVWAYAIGGSGSEQGNDVAVDESGNVYVTGFFGGTVDFDPSGATANLVSVGSNEAFIAKYSSSGAYLWAKAMGGTGLDLGISIAVEANGNVHVTGTFNGTADFDPSGATANLVSSGFTDIFIAKYDGSGNYLWAKAIGGTSSDVVNSLAVDGSGNVHIAGNLTGTIDFDPSGAIANLNSVGGSDIFIAKYDSAGNYVWAKAMGGTNNELGSGIALDGSGNVYITGSFNTTADFDPSAAVANLVSAGLTDTYFAKYDSSGAYVWAFRVGNTSIDSGNSIAVDDAGNVNLIGNFWDTIDFNPGAGVANVSVSGSQGIFIAKYNTSGAYIWAKGLGGSSGNENGNAIALDGSGNVHITGYLQGSGDFDPSGVVVNLSSINDVSAFAGKYTSAAGNYVYAFAVADGNGGSEDGKSIVLDASGNIFVTGVFAGLVDFDPSGASAVLSSAGGYDIYIAKYNSLGNYVWAKSMGGTNNDWGLSLTLDGSGNVLVTGYFMGTADFDPSGATANLTGAGGSQDAFIAKYDASGNYVWAKGIGGTSADQSNAIAVDGSGNVHITGTFLGTADFDPSAATANLVSVGSNDIFIAKYNSSGVYVWAKAMGSPGASSADVGNSIALDASGNVHITGYFQGTADFDPSGAVASLVTAGNTDIFIAKYNSSGAYVWAKRMGGTGSDLGYSIALDGSGNIHVTGSFNGTADFDPSAAVVNLVSAGSTDVFMGKYDAAGAYLWANRMGGTAADIGIAVALDGTGNAYITGSFNGTADFDPSGAVANLVSAGNTDIFIGKYNTSGNYVWAKGMGGTSADKGNAYALDACGYTHITGSFMLTADFDHSAGTANLTSIGAQDFFIAQYGGCIPPSFLVSPLGNVPAFTDPGLCTAVVSYTVTVSGCPAPALTYLFTGATSGSGNGTGAGYTFNKGVTSVTLTATNACGAPTVSFTVTVTDNHAPVISNCAVVRNINGCNVGAITGPAYSTTPAASSYAEFSNVVNMGLASDNCAITSVTYQDAAAGTCPIVVTRTWTVTDEAGFMATCNQTINVNAPPVTVTCPMNATEAAGQDQATIDAAFEAWLLTVSYSGGCNASISNTNTGAPQACGGSTTVIWTVESDCEADVTCSAIFEVLVTNIPVTISGPSAVCSGSDAILDAGPGYATYGWSHGGGSSQTATFPNMTMATTFTVSVTDANNCTGFDTHTVNVNPLPVVTCPGNSAMCIDAGAFALTGAGPMGGTYSGPGVSAGMFNPGAAGAGMHTITYTYTDGNNCTAFCTFSITVNPLPVVTCPDNSAVCIDAGAFALTGGNPMGGTYSGPGVNAGMFNPGAAGAGMHTITYTYTDGNNCTASCTFTITVSPLPVVTCPDNSAVCIDAGAFPLTGGNPMAGTYSGPGVNAGMFNPATAGIGAHTITYTYTDGNNCTASCTFTITVSPLPVVTCPGNSAVCIDAGAFPLTGGNPMGGTYSGPGVNAGMFNPATAGLGAHMITYTYTDGNNCTASCNFSITVNALPVVTCPGNSAVCIDAGAFALTGASPMGGTYSGPGVNAGMFNPSAAGTGVHTITYTYTDGNNCTASCTFTITVNPLPVVTCPMYSPVCIDASAFALAGGSPMGGTYSGPGVNAGMFNPSAAGAGAHAITYTYTDGNNCTASCTFTITVNALPVVTCPTNSAVCIDAGAFPLTGGSPMGGTYSGPGVSAGMFNPGAAGAGAHMITYTYTDGNNCTASCTFTITVNALPVVTCPIYSPVCIDASAFALAGGSPMGGTYSGPGVNAGMFNPGAAGAGAHTITYTYTDGNNCTNSCTFTITVAVQSTVTCPSNATVCINISPYALTGGNPGGGAYSGPGVNAGMFNPAAAGTGVHTITYTYPIGSNCSNWCTFTITVIPCTTISGDILWEQNEGLGVNQVTVKLTGDQTLTTTTNTSGFYSLNPGSGSNFIVTPTKTINKLNGVTVADVTAIQQHVANINLLPAPFKRIAADVNKSNTISSLDATLISQALLGNPAALNQITSWRFVPYSYTFPNPNIPWGFPEKIILTGVSGDVPNQDFKGIKLGDVVATFANPANFGAGEPLVLRAADRELRMGESFAVEIIADQMNDLAAFQFALGFDPSLVQLEGVEPLAGLPLTADHFGTFNAAQGEIRVAWSQENGLTLSEATPLFRLIFSALENGSKLSGALYMEEDILPAKAYSEALAESGVQLIIEQTTALNEPATGRANFQLLPNFPNPFHGSTTIEFILPESCEVQLRVLNVDGQELWRVNKTYPAGNNSETLFLDGTVSSGVLYCEMVTPFGALVRKMVLMQR